MIGGVLAGMLTGYVDRVYMLVRILTLCVYRVCCVDGST